MIVGENDLRSEFGFFVLAFVDLHCSLLRADFALQVSRQNRAWIFYNFYSARHQGNPKVVTDRIPDISMAGG